MQGILRSNQKGFARGFPSARIFHSLVCDIRLRRRAERLSLPLLAVGNGEPGFPYLESARLPPVIPCTAGNPYERREPREISLNGLVPLSYLPPTSSTSIFHERRSSTPAFSNTSHRRSPFCACTGYILLCGTVSALTDEITHIAPMTMDVTCPVNYR